MPSFLFCYFLPVLSLVNPVLSLKEQGISLLLMATRLKHFVNMRHFELYWPRVFESFKRDFNEAKAVYMWLAVEIYRAAKRRGKYSATIHRD